MAATKALATLFASASNSTTAVTNSTVQNLSTAYGGIITGTITNNATAPSTGCLVTCQVSGDNTTFDTWQSFVATVTASAVTPFAFDIPLHILFTRVTFAATSTLCTCVARIEYTTGI